MKKLVLMLVVTYLTACGGGNTEDDPTPSEKGSITGFVTDNNSGSVVKDVSVKASGKESITGDDGAYTINDIDIGEVTISATKSGFTDYSDKATIANGQTTSHDIVLNVLPSSSCIAKPSSLIAWWAGDNNANDYFSENNAQIVNGVSYEQGQVDQGFVFNGVDQYLTIDDNSNINPNSEITASAWVKLENTGDYQIILAKFYSNYVNGAGDDSYLLGITPNGGLYWAIETLNNSVLSDNQIATSAVNVFDNNYHMVTATYDGNKIAVYLDGEEISSKAVTGSIQASPGTPLHIGANSNRNNMDWFSKGNIDEVMIFDTALSIESIKEIFESGNSGLCK